MFEYPQVNMSNPSSCSSETNEQVMRPPVRMMKGYKSNQMRFCSDVVQHEIFAPAWRFLCDRHTRIEVIQLMEKIEGCMLSILCLNESMSLDCNKVVKRMVDDLLLHHRVLTDHMTFVSENEEKKRCKLEKAVDRAHLIYLLRRNQLAAKAAGLS